jgi:hypothetical protein
VILSESVMAVAVMTTIAVRQCHHMEAKAAEHFIAEIAPDRDLVIVVDLAEVSMALDSVMTSVAVETMATTVDEVAGEDSTSVEATDLMIAVVLHLVNLTISIVDLLVDTMEDAKVMTDNGNLSLMLILLLLLHSSAGWPHHWIHWCGSLSCLWIL